MIHALKILPEFFKAMAAGTKSFEVRKNDRPYHTGDYVALNEWNSEQYTGKCTLQKVVYILNDPEYCKEGYVILGLEPCAIGEIKDECIKTKEAREYIGKYINIIGIEEI